MCVCVCVWEGGGGGVQLSMSDRVASLPDDVLRRSHLYNLRMSSVSRGAAVYVWVASLQAIWEYPL